MTSYFNEILCDFVDQLDIENTKTSVWCILYTGYFQPYQIDYCKSNWQLQIKFSLTQCFGKEK